jgi:hypothetical protein
MSLRFSSLSPALVSVAGGAVIAGLPYIKLAAAPIGLLQGLNVAAFALNCFAVSVPGRIDGQEDQSMRAGNLNPNKPELEALLPREYAETYSPSRGRTLVSPSGWAFAIWGPIYLGETVLLAAQFFSQSGLLAVLPEMTAPFVAANVFQSLWCASFRPSFKGWASYVSPLMLAGTAYSLSQVHATTLLCKGGVAPFFLWPLTLHFGWTCAATLVNLSGSVAMEPSNSNRLVTAVGHASAILATVLGVCVTINPLPSPLYGITLAWALAACADGMSKREGSMNSDDGDLHEVVRVQKYLCWTGALACALAAASTFFR